MKQGQVPVVVHGQRIGVGPERGLAAQPVDAVAWAALHFADVGNGVDGPGVVGVQGHRRTAQGFGPRVLAAFLQAKRLHAQQVTPAAVVRAPGAERAPDAVAQQRRLAEHQVLHVGELQRQQIAWVVHQVAVQQAVGAGHVAGGPDRQGRLQGPLAQVRRPVARGSRGQVQPRLRQELAVDRAQHERRQSLVGVDEAGVVGQGGLERLDRVQSQAVELRQGGVPGGDAAVLVGRQRQAVGVAADGG